MIVFCGCINNNIIIVGERSSVHSAFQPINVNLDPSGRDHGSLACCASDDDPGAASSIQHPAWDGILLSIHQPDCYFVIISSNTSVQRYYHRLGITAT